MQQATRIIISVLLAASSSVAFAEPDLEGVHAAAAADVRGEIRFYNELFATLNLPPMGEPVVRLHVTTTNATSGITQGGQIDLTFPLPTYDRGTLLHEVGHCIHDHLRPFSRHVEAINKMAFQRIFIEGMASLLGGLYSGNPAIGVDRYEMKNDMSSEISLRFPDQLFTQKQFYEKIRTARLYARSYPLSAKRTLMNYARDLKEGNTWVLSQPEIYTSSAVWTQPLWRASTIFGRETIAKITVEALLNKKGTDSDLQALVTSILTEAKAESPTLYQYLSTEYEKRGFGG